MAMNGEHNPHKSKPMMEGSSKPRQRRQNILRKKRGK